MREDGREPSCLTSHFAGKRGGIITNREVPDRYRTSTNNQNNPTVILYNWNIVGHQKLLEALERDITQGTLSHAYLFAGPEKVGKYTVAKKMAGILQCKENFCHNCPTCIQIEKGGHPDTIEFKGNEESLKVAEMREVIARLNLSTVSPYKIFLVEAIERMTPEAANCLLKTLEEPPQNTIFLFTTISLREVLPTIRSRMRVVKFHHCPDEAIKNELKILHPEADQGLIEQVSRFSLGKPGVAFQLMRNPEKLDLYRNLYQDLLRFLEGEAIFERFLYVQQCSEDSKKLEILLDILTHVVRSKLLKEEEFRRKYLDLVDKIDFTKYLLKRNVNTKLALEHLMLAL